MNNHRWLTIGLIAALLVMGLILPSPSSARTASLSPVPKMQFFDSNGDPLAGGLLYTCKPGTVCGPATTTDLKPTYTDYGAATANTNPIVMDAAGRANIWLYGYYKMALYTATGVLIWTVDNVSSSGALEGVDLCSYTDLATAITEIGATVTTLVVTPGCMPNNVSSVANVIVPANITLKWESCGGVLTRTGAGAGYLIIRSTPSNPLMCQMFNDNTATYNWVKFSSNPGNPVENLYLEWWGGKNNNNGATGIGVDNKPMFYMAINSLPLNSGRIQLLAGQYRITDYIDVQPATASFSSANGIEIRGMGAQNTIVRMDNDTPTTVAATIGSISTVFYNGHETRLRLRDFAIGHTKAYVPVYSWHPAYAVYNEGGNSTIDNVETAGFDYGVYLYGANGNTLRKVRTPYCRHGITVDTASFGTRLADCDTESTGNSNAGMGMVGWGVKLNYTGSTVIENLINSYGPNWIIQSNGVQVIGGNYETCRSVPCWHVSGKQIEVKGNILSVVAGNKFSRTTGSWITDGFEVGDKLLTWGWTNLGNVTANVSPFYFTVTNVAATELTVSDTLTVEAAHTDGTPTVISFSGNRLASSWNWSRGITFKGGRYWNSYGFIFYDGSGWVDIEDTEFYNFYPLDQVAYIKPLQLSLNILSTNQNYLRNINYRNVRWLDNTEPQHYGAALYGHILKREGVSKLPAIPTTGTYETGDHILSSTDVAYTWYCTLPGTFGVLNGGGTTGTIVVGTSTNLVVLNSMVGIFPGAHITIAGANLTENGDASTQMSSWVVNYPVAATLYWGITDAAGTRTVTLWSDVAHTVPVAAGSLVGDGSVVLVEVGGSGTSGTVTIAYTVDDFDAANTLVFSGLGVKIGDVDYATKTAAFYPPSPTSVLAAAISYTTPELKRVYGAQLDRSSATVTVTGAIGRTVLREYTLPTRYMNTDSCVDVFAEGDKTGATNAKTIELRFGTTYLSLIAANDTNRWKVDAKICNVASLVAQKVSYTFWDNSTPTTYQGTLAEDTRLSPIIGLYATVPGAADTTTLKLWRLDPK